MFAQRRDKNARAHEKTARIAQPRPTIAAIMLISTPRALQALALSLTIGCANVIGLNELAVKSERADAGAPDVQCHAQRDCADSGSVCRAGACVRLKSSDCPVITGDYSDDSAILIGSLFAFGGAQAGASMARQNSAILAVEEINGSGGIPQHGTSANPRPWCSCPATAAQTCCAPADI